MDLNVGQEKRLKIFDFLNHNKAFLLSFCYFLLAYEPSNLRIFTTPTQDTLFSVHFVVFRKPAGPSRRADCYTAWSSNGKLALSVLPTTTKCRFEHWTGNFSITSWPSTNRATTGNRKVVGCNNPFNFGFIFICLLFKFLLLLSISGPRSLPVVVAFSDSRLSNRTAENRCPFLATRHGRHTHFMQNAWFIRKNIILRYNSCSKISPNVR